MSIHERIDILLASAALDPDTGTTDAEILNAHIHTLWKAIGILAMEIDTRLSEGHDPT